MGLLVTDFQDSPSGKNDPADMAVLYDTNGLSESLTLLRSLNETPVLCIVPEKYAAETFSSQLSPGARRMILQYPLELADIRNALRALLS